MSHDVHEDANLLLELMNEVDNQTITAKLLSMLLSKESFMGPDHIGIKEGKEGRESRGKKEFHPKNSSPQKKTEKKGPPKFFKKKSNQFHATNRRKQVKSSKS